MMQRILIIGCSGAGKTTLARKLSDLLGLELIHLDREFWRPGWTAPDLDDWYAHNEELIAGESWIMDGNYGNTLSLRLRRADTVIWLDLSRRLCLWRVLWRLLWNYGQVRPEMTEGCPERYDREFLRYVYEFPEKHRPRIVEKLKAFPPEKSLHILRTKREVARFLREVRRSRAG